MNNIGKGFNPISNRMLALDYLRQDIFPKKELFESFPVSQDNISNLLDKYLENHENIIVFGTKYGNDYNETGHYGKMRSIEQNVSETGVDDVHYNQGNRDHFSKYNNIYQDGALFIENNNHSYTAVFFAFSEQCSDTDDNGNCIEIKRS